MALTYQDIVDLAREPLNDTDKARYADGTLMIYTNSAILSLYQRRPDLFIGQFGNLPTGQADLADTFPLPPGYMVTLADYVTARAEMIDDEHANTGRAAAFMQLLNAEVP